MPKFNQKLRKTLHFLGGSTAFLLLAIAVFFLVPTKKKSLRAGEQNVMMVTAEPVIVQSDVAKSEKLLVPVNYHDGLPVTIDRNAPVEETGISKNSEVLLTNKQAEF